MKTLVKICFIRSSLTDGFTDDDVFGGQAFGVAGAVAENQGSHSHIHPNSISFLTRI